MAGGIGGLRIAFALKTQVELANVVEGGERRQARHIDLVEIAFSGEHRESATEDRGVQQGLGARRNVGAMRGERVPGDDPVVRIAFQLPPKGGRDPFHSVRRRSSSARRIPGASLLRRFPIRPAGYVRTASLERMARFSVNHGRVASSDSQVLNFVVDSAVSGRAPCVWAAIRHRARLGSR